MTFYIPRVLKSQQPASQPVSHGNLPTTSPPAAPLPAGRGGGTNAALPAAPAPHERGRLRRARTAGVLPLPPLLAAAASRSSAHSKCRRHAGGAGRRRPGWERDGGGQAGRPSLALGRRAGERGLSRGDAAERDADGSEPSEAVRRGSGRSAPRGVPATVLLDAGKTLLRGWVR